MLLIVDDNDTVREMLVAILEAADYRVREAADGCKALDLAREEPPGLVLMDITMPGMTGYQVLAQMRAIFGETLPIILVSALPADDERATAIARGATDYISKPFDIPSILDCVKHYLSSPDAA